PKKDAKAITAAGNVVDEWACEYGIPEAVLSDGAKCFQSKLSDLVYDFLDIRRLKTIPFNPQCDGLINDHGKVVVMEDVEDTILTNSADVAENYLNELKEKMSLSYKIAATNRSI
ncbi:Transposon Ty3-I Gag-Pol poly, partial [Brachionus plicatilis]